MDSDEHFDEWPGKIASFEWQTKQYKELGDSAMSAESLLNHSNRFILREEARELLTEAPSFMISDLPYLLKKRMLLFAGYAEADYDDYLRNKRNAAKGLAAPFTLDALNEKAAALPEVQTTEESNTDYLWNGKQAEETGEPTGTVGHAKRVARALVGNSLKPPLAIKTFQGLLKSLIVSPPSSVSDLSWYEQEQQYQAYSKLSRSLAKHQDTLRKEVRPEELEALQTAIHNDLHAWRLEQIIALHSHFIAEDRCGFPTKKLQAAKINSMIREVTDSEPLNEEQSVRLEEVKTSVAEHLEKKKTKAEELLEGRLKRTKASLSETAPSDAENVAPELKQQAALPIPTLSAKPDTRITTAVKIVDTQASHTTADALQNPVEIKAVASAKRLYNDLRIRKLPEGYRTAAKAAGDIIALMRTEGFTPQMIDANSKYEDGQFKRSLIKMSREIDHGQRGPASVASR